MTNTCFLHSVPVSDWFAKSADHQIPLLVSGIPSHLSASVKAGLFGEKSQQTMTMLRQMEN